jgi:hypothetical protein
MYSTLAPSLLHSISTQVTLGRLPRLHHGSIILARMESRILMMRGIEDWFESNVVSITGAELEPTSCHALEGTQVDNVLDKILDQHSKFTWFNSNFFHTLKPLGLVEADAYSESKIMTTGILDHPEALSKIHVILFKVLVYYLRIRLSVQELNQYFFNIGIDL